NAKFTKEILQMRTLFRFAAGVAVALTMSLACFGQHYKQTDLVSNTSGSAPVVDPQLTNAWGLSLGSGSAWWVSDQATGVSTLYNGAGEKQILVVTIPPADPTNKNTPKGSPTGTIFNGSQTDFLLAPGKPAVFLFCTGDGTIAGWNPNVAIDQGAAPPSGPRGYVPFNVQAIGDNIVGTYVLHEQGSPFESDGPGLGFVDIYRPTGQLLRRLEHGDWLNAPWGVALAPLDFGRVSHDLLIGQFAGAGNTQSSGYIAAYDLATGKCEGVLPDASGKPLTINGIWALGPGNVSPGNSDASAAPAAQLYFTAGPNQGSAGLFGYLTAVSAELVEGNDQ